MLAERENQNIIKVMWKIQKRRRGRERFKNVLEKLKMTYYFNGSVLYDLCYYLSPSPSSHYTIFILCFHGMLRHVQNTHTHTRDDSSMGLVWEGHYHLK